MSADQTVLILGAGLAGSCTALDLARKGVSVVLVDQDQLPMNRASLRNEGKIHLGLCYAVDTSMATGSLMLEGALSFRRLMKDWIGEPADSLQLSTPFVYAVAEDSILDAGELETRYAALESIYRKRLAEDEGLDYFGGRPERLAHRAPDADVAQYFCDPSVKAMFHTEELAINPEELAVLVREAIEAHPRISFVPGLRVEGVTSAGSTWEISGQKDGREISLRGRQVVNALWNGRLVFDKQVGLLSDDTWLHRLKYRVVIRLPEPLRSAHSVTMVVGRYGDVVIRPDGTGYLSWYPSGLQGWSHELDTPPSWEEACRGEPEKGIADVVSASMIRHIARWYPGVSGYEILQVDAGTILARGKTDVDDRSSELHQRTAIGVKSSGGYHSLNPGKLTTAPLFAREAAEKVMRNMS